MHFTSLSSFTNKLPGALGKGPTALIFIEDSVEVESTLRHHLALGFESVVAIGRDAILPRDLDGIDTVEHEFLDRDAVRDTTNAIVKLAGDGWIYTCYNAEYLYFPFCETRSVKELVAFAVEERRAAIYNFVIDLYSTDLGKDGNGVSKDRAFLDRTGYYALARKDEEGRAFERQMEFFGGLKWRYEEHIPWQRRRIDRPGLFAAKRGLRLTDEMRFSDEEYNTYECPWHNNLTTATCSFRTAKALLSNPGSRHMVGHFWWENSEAFHWSSGQLMELGLMEPGQWF